MAWLKKTKLLPGAAGSHVWHTREDVVEVDDALAVELLEIPDAGFVSVAAPEPDATAEPDGEAGGESKDVDEPPARPAAKKAAASKSAAAKTPVQE